MALPRGERQRSEIRHLFGDLGKLGGIVIQGVSDADPKPKFEPVEHSVYLGRRRLGRYSRIAPRKYAAFDACDRPLGEFKRRKDAWRAIGRAGEGVAQ
jgi:hypothetical protein